MSTAQINSKPKTSRNLMIAKKNSQFLEALEALNQKQPTTGKTLVNSFPQNPKEAEVMPMKHDELLKIAPRKSAN